MVVGLCPKAGSGILRLRWQTRRNLTVEREWLVQRGLPGEVLEMEFGVVKEKRWPHGDLEVYPNLDMKRVWKSPFEVRPPCPHYERCGGCDFLHLTYGRQLVEKQRWVEQALLAARVPLSKLARIRPSEPQLRYASRVEWVLSEVETEPHFGPPGAGPDGVDALPPSGCMLPPRAATRALTAFFDAFCELRKGNPQAYSIYEEKRGLGRFKSVVALCTRAPASAVRGPRAGGAGRRTELLLNVVIAEDIADVAGVLEPLARAIAEASPSCLAGIVANVARSKRDLMGGRREVLLHGRRFVRQEMSVKLADGAQRSFTLEVGAGSRPLAHSGALAEVAAAVVELCALSSTDTVWHLHCGSGELSLALGAVCEHVVAIGTAASEVAELKRNLAANKVSNTTSVLCNLKSPWTLKQLSFHITQSQQRRLLLTTGYEQEKAREFALTCFVPGEGRRRQLQRLAAGPFTAPLLREDALAQRELQVLLPAFVRDFRPSRSTLPVPVGGAGDSDDAVRREVPPEMETRLKRLYRRLAFKYHPDRNPGDPEASDRFQALTRAYRALVGDTAGPEEGDDKAEDPFLKAMASSYRPKFKHRWMRDVPSSQEKRAAAAAAPPAADAASSSSTQPPPPPGAEAEAAPEAEGVEEGSESDHDFDVKMEIDEAWASPSETAGTLGPTTDDAAGDVDLKPEIIFREGADQLAATGEAAVVKTLPPPDVIVVTQRVRKAGRGAPRHFTSWLRSTAARTIVYVATDAEAFQADLKALMELGYGLERVQPFDPEPHRRGLLLVARMSLIRPLVGSEEYGPEGERLLAGAPHLLPGAPGGVPLLGSGGYAALPAR